MEDQNSKKESSKPVEVFRALGVSASVFENRSDKGVPFDKVQIVRTYRSGDDFRSVPTFSVDELPLVASFAQKAYDYCIQRRDQSRKDRSDS